MTRTISNMYGFLLNVEIPDDMHGNKQKHYSVSTGRAKTRTL